MSNDPSSPTPKLIYERVMKAMMTADPDSLVKLSAALKNLHDIIHGTASGSVSVLEQLLQVSQPTNPNESSIPEHLKVQEND